MHRDELIDCLAKHHNELILYALKLTGNMHDAEDIVGDLCISILERDDDAEEVRYPKAFFKTCLRNSSYNYSLSKSRTVAVDIDDPAVSSIMADKGSDLSDVEFLLSLNKRLSQYPRELVEAFCMRYLDGYPLQEVARLMGIPSNTLSQKFRRLRKTLSRSAPNLWMMIMAMGI